MKSVLYLGCPTPERSDTERMLGAADLSVIWADNVACALSELQRHDVPVLLDLSRGAAALQSAREIRSHRAATLMFAVVDARRPDITTEAVLAGIADVFARPLGGRRVATAQLTAVYSGGHDGTWRATNDDRGVPGNGHGAGPDDGVGAGHTWLTRRDGHRRLGFIGARSHRDHHRSRHQHRDLRGVE